MAVAMHVVEIAGLIAASVWLPWVSRNLREIMSSPVGLLLLACWCFALLIGAEALYYSGARYLHLQYAVDIRNDSFVFAIVGMRGIGLLGFLLMMIAHWRIEGLGSAAIRRRAYATIATGFGIFAAVSAILW